MTSNFVELCSQLADIAGWADGAFHAGDNGVLRMEMRIDGVPVQVLAQGVRPKQFFSHVEFGAAPPLREFPARSHRVPCSFIRDESTAALILRHCWPATTTPRQLYARLKRQARLAKGFSAQALTTASAR